MQYHFLILFIIFAQALNAQKHIDSKLFNINTAQYAMIHVYNTGGAVEVKGTRSAEAKIEVKRTLKATNKKRLERAIKEIHVDTMVVDDELFVFINSPYKKLKPGYNQQYLNYQSPQNQWNNKNGIRQVGIESIFELKISLPVETKLVVSTHRGPLKVENVKGSLVALNHHDDVKLLNVRDVLYAHSHHGDVQVDFVGQPSNDIAFDTHHGDIKVSFPETPSVEVEFDSYHGSFYTDFQWNEKHAKFQKVTSKSKRKATYKLGDKTIVSMGNGSQKMTFDSHHGDFYILKN